MTPSELRSIGCVLAITLPLVLACGTLIRWLRGASVWMASWAPALPALAVAITLPAGPSVEADSVLLGMRVYRPDLLTQGFLFSSSLVWLASGGFARAYLTHDPRREVFWFFFLVTMGGNVGTVLADDIASFYLFYAVMTFAAYGLVIHEQTEAADRAGRVYLVMALFGEVFLLAAFWLIVRSRVDVGLADVPRLVASDPRRDLIIGLLFVGFGVKAGIVPLHLWLPLAHPVAPTPASAILSGALIHAGLLGWLRLLPLGEVALGSFGAVASSIGILTAFYGAIVGSLQSDPKTVLAYSSVSQMGFMTCALGLALAAPSVGEAAKVTLVVFSTHHAIAKGALFLGSGVARVSAPRLPRRAVRAGLLLPALAIAGAPFTSGAMAKSSLEAMIEAAPTRARWLEVPLSIAAVGSTLLMIRFIHVVVPTSAGEAAAPQRPSWLWWSILLVCGGVIVVRPTLFGLPAEAFVTPRASLGAVWPIVAGVAVAWAVRRAMKRGAVLPSVPPGDLLSPLASAGRIVGANVGTMTSAVRERGDERFRAMLRRLDAFVERAGLSKRIELAEGTITRFDAIGALVLVLILLLAPLLGR